ncbi:hypothetical protein BDV25DRAFT_136214 [Aspergillus avenaceus]|uniref:Uncharacterized protein n=1 Tax=Aspergillus avenaceus TaxID=36643 RepID=A0A5N6U6L2_ASPAV|nr:hypothetical protein BDV25DRAFT_136214 [Aspergillus avenaceus]
MSTAPGQMKSTEEGDFISMFYAGPRKILRGSFSQPVPQLSAEVAHLEYDAFDDLSGSCDLVESAWIGPTEVNLPFKNSEDGIVTIKGTLMSPLDRRYSVSGHGEWLD